MQELPRDFFAAFGGMDPQPGQWDGTEAGLIDILRGVADPEIPQISIVDLGIVRAARLAQDAAEITLTPTYVGCPATEVIRRQVFSTLAAAGVPAVRIEFRLSPPWTTDWLSETARAALQQGGIAPPCAGVSAPRTLALRPACPRCHSHHTAMISEFGATPCKALWRCQACHEPFDYFKPL